MEIWDTYIPHKLGDTSGEYEKWKAKVLAIRDMSEHRLKKLWKLNFSPADIAANKHWAVFPPPKPPRSGPGLPIGFNRGRGVSEHSVQLRYAQALLKEARKLLAYSRMEPRVLEKVREDEKRFAQIALDLKRKTGVLPPKASTE